MKNDERFEQQHTIMAITCIRLKKNGTLTESPIDDSKTKKIIHTYIDKDYSIRVYASVDGVAGQENKHELPPPLDTRLLFGDTYLVRYDKNKTLSNFSKKQFKKFIDDFNGGFDDIGSQDTWSSEEELSDSDSIHDFIVPG